MARRKKNDIDSVIEQIWYARFNGIAINILDIGKVFAAGRAAAAAGADIEVAVIAKGNELTGATVSR